MAVLDADAFTYSNGALATVSGGKWTPLSGFLDLTVASNGLTGPVADDGAAVITAWSGSTTVQYAQVTVRTALDDGGPTVYSDGIDTFYLLSLRGAAQNVILFKSVAGVLTILDDQLDVVPVDGDVGYLENQGGMIVTKLNDTIMNVCADSSIPSGKPGVYVSFSAMVIEDWEAGSPVAPRVVRNYEFFPKALLSDLDHVPDGT